MVWNLQVEQLVRDHIILEILCFGQQVIAE